MTLTREDLNRIPNTDLRWASGETAVKVCRQVLRDADVIAYDFETRGLDRKNDAATVVSVSDGRVAAVLDVTSPRHIEAARVVLAEAKMLAVHNLSMDLPYALQLGLVEPDDTFRTYDTMTASRISHPGGNCSKLGDVAERLLPPNVAALKVTLEDAYSGIYASRSKAFQNASPMDAAYQRYACSDALLTALLVPLTRQEVLGKLADATFDYGREGRSGRAMAVDAHNTSQRVNQICVLAGVLGMNLDYDQLDIASYERDRTIIECLRVLGEFGVEPDTTDVKAAQLVVSGLEFRGLLPEDWPPTKTTGKPKTDKATIERKLVGNPIGEALIEFKKARAWSGKYADKLIDLADDSGRVRWSVNTYAAVTGRMSVSDPPLQQWPPALRKLLKADEDITSIDYTSIEPLLAGVFTGTDDLVEAYMGGDDIYQPVVDAAGCSRAAAKIVLLALLYGSGTARTAAQLGIDIDEAERIHAAVRDEFGGLERFQLAVEHTARRKGGVMTLGGRVLPLPVYNGVPKTSVAVNWIVQGSALDVLADAIYRIHDAGLSRHIVLAVHDELVVHTSAADDVLEVMQQPMRELGHATPPGFQLRCERVDFGSPSWGEKKED